MASITQSTTYTFMVEVEGRGSIGYVIEDALSGEFYFELGGCHTGWRSGETYKDKWDALEALMKAAKIIE